MKIAILSLILCFSIVPILSNCITPRVLEGDIGNIADHKWLVSIFEKTPLRFKCAGTLVNYNWVLTSGHCARHHNMSYWVRAGSNMTNEGGLLSPVVAIHHFSRYRYINHNNSLYDMALLRLETEIFRDDIQPIQLPRGADVLLPGTKLIVAGWGMPNSEHDPFSKPSKHFPFRDIAMSVVNFNEYEVNPSMLVDKLDVENLQTLVYKGCPGLGACAADVGSPVVQNTVLFGVILPGHDCGTSKQYATLMTKVPIYTKWIHEVISSNLTNPLTSSDNPENNEKNPLTSTNIYDIDRSI